jgi:hypothetical protein
MQALSDKVIVELGKRDDPRAPINFDEPSVRDGSRYIRSCQNAW